MEKDRLKNRLVGVAVIVALGVIVLPLIFDAEGYRQLEPLRLEVPGGPTFSIRKDVSDLLKTQSELDAEAAAIKKDIMLRKQRPEWTVIVGSFKFPENAGKLVVELKNAGYDAETLESKEGNESYYVVELGPFPDKRKATDVAEVVSEKFSVVARVVER